MRTLILQHYNIRQVTDIDDLDSLVDLQELECDGDILQLLVAERRTLVELPEAFSAENFDQRDESQSIGEVRGQVGDVLVDGLEMLVRPACEAVLLDQFPLGVAGQVPFLGVVHYDFAHRSCNESR